MLWGRLSKNPLASIIRPIIMPQENAMNRDANAEPAPMMIRSLPATFLMAGKRIAAAKVANKTIIRAGPSNS